MTCTAPLSHAALVDYWTHDLSEADVFSVEEHLFACDHCTARLAGIESMAASIRRLTERGRLRSFVAPSLVERLAAGGLRIRTYRPRSGETIPCGTAPDDDLLLSRIAVDLGGVTRVDVSFVDERGAEERRYVDVPFDRARDEIVFAQRVDDPHLRTAHVVRFRLIAVEGESERELGTYVLAHDPRGPPVP